MLGSLIQKIFWGLPRPHFSRAASAPRLALGASPSPPKKKFFFARTALAGLVIVFSRRLELARSVQLSGEPPQLSIGWTSSST